MKQMVGPKSGVLNGNLHMFFNANILTNNMMMMLALFFIKNCMIPTFEASYV